MHHPQNILIKSLTGDTTSEEMEFLEQWLLASEDNRQLAQGIRKAWDMGKAQWPELPFDADAHFAQLMAHNKAQGPVLEARAGGRARAFWLVAASLALLAVATWWLWRPAQPALLVAEAVDKPLQLVLSDGSTLRLENGSVRYPAHFSEKNRVIYLDRGQAILTVVHDEHKPFRVETTLGSIQDLGTKFWISCNDSTLETIVSEGKVRLSPGTNGLAMDLEVGEGARYNSRSRTLTQVKDSELNQFAEERGYFQYTNHPLGDVLSALATKDQCCPKGVDIPLELAKCRFSGRLPTTATVADNLKALRAVFGFDHRVEDGKLILTSGGCK
jgi:transmembrane sensor